MVTAMTQVLAPDTPAGPAVPSTQADWAERAEARTLAAACALAAEGLRWDEPLAARAARQAGLSEADAALLLPQGPRDLAALLWRRHDTQTLLGLGQLDPAVKVRERIRRAVQARVDAALGDRAAVETASRYLARPDRAGLAFKLGWETADGLWRWAGDTSTDENHYSKRALLWGILAGTLAVRLARGEDAAARYLDARIEGVMRFEKWKAALPPLDQALTVAAATLGRLRYRG